MHDILALLQLKSIGRKTIQKIGIDELIRTRNDKLPEAIKKAEVIRAFCKKNGIQIVTEFPEALRSILEPPILLFCKGDVSLINSNRSIAIVGSRKPTDYGLRAAYRLSQIFTEKGYTIVSGLATGIDTAAHTACLDHGGKTIAVMPCSLDKVYPASNKELAHRILDSGGLLISEYTPGSALQKSYFVERDRLQSGLSQGVIVVETTEDGGTMHTARFALQQGRFLGVMTPPEKYINDEHYSGNIQLIKEQKVYEIKDSESIEVFDLKINEKKQELVIEYNGQKYRWTGKKWRDAANMEPPLMVVNELNKILNDMDNIDLDSMSADELLEKARVYRDNNNLQKAKKLAELGIEKADEEKRGPALAIYCSILRRIGKPNLLLLATQKYVNTVQSGYLYTTRAAAYCDLEEWELAKKEILKALSIKKSKEAFTVLGRIKANKPDLFD